MYGRGSVAFMAATGGQDGAWHIDGVGVSLHHIVIDAHDLPALARFWGQVLGWRILSEREREVVIGADEGASVGICFTRSPRLRRSRTVCTSTSIPVTMTAIPRSSASWRWVPAGVNIGQIGAESWTVLADSEGNEFCVLRAKKTLID